MYRHLYDCFKHWYHDDKGTIFFYSDPHFNDSDMLFLRKNNITDNEQVKRINSKIGKYDTIIFLGDIGDVDYIEKIRGYKVLVLGNHDRGANNYKKNEQNGLLFDEVYEGPLIISEKIILSHEPIEIPCMLNIHGHDHSNFQKNPYGINVCAENINYTPLAFNTIIKSGVLKKIKDIHRITIDKAVNKI